MNAWLVITSGNASGDRRTVITYSSQTLTPDRAFSGTVASTNTYEIHRLFNPDRVDEAINAAILESKSRWPNEIEDASLTFTVNTYTYSLNLTDDPDYVWLLDKIEYDTGASGTGYPYAPLDRGLWSVRQDYDSTTRANTFTLQLSERANDIIPTGKTMRLTFRSRPPTLSADTGAGGTLAPDNEAFIAYICAKSCGLLYDSRANQTKQKGDRETAQNFHFKAEQILTADKPMSQPGGFILEPENQNVYVERDVSKIHIPWR